MQKLCIVVATGVTINSFMLKHIEYLSKYYDITILVGDDIIKNKNLKIKNISINRKIHLIQDLKSLLEIYLFLKKEHFDVILSITPKAGLLAMLAAWLSNVNIRIHFFTGQVWATKKGLFKLILKLMDKIIVQTSSHILIDSHSQKEFLIHENILTQKKASVLNNGSISGVNIDKFKQDILIKNQLKIQYEITNEIVFMFMGRLNKDKGILDIASVFNTLLKKYPKKIKLFIVGTAEENIENNIIELLNSNNVIRIGHVANPEHILNVADILILPSYREGFGTIVIEAAAMKIPTIGSNIYGLNDAIVDNVTGLLHIKGNQKDMLKKYEYIIKNNLKIKNYSDSAYNRILKDFIDYDLSLALVDYILHIKTQKLES